MKFSAPIIVLSATALVEAQLNALPHSATQKRDLSTMNTVLGQVLEGLTSLNQVCQQYSGSPGGDIKSGMDMSLTTVKTATETCQKMGPIPAGEAEGFKPTAEKLGESGEKLVSILDSKVPLFEKNHICGPVLGWFGGLGKNVGVLMKTVASKMPNNGTATETAQAAAYKTKFGVLADKLKACSGNATAVSANPSGAETTHKAQEVTQSGASTMSASFGVLALAAAAATMLL
ncbi:cell wall protein [Apiospora kogelbergensis]|uniref:Cell wall protein n=1 Tax=Apiospora kogelbergensis TaxID=1337665 RepID=A0AAW0QJI7_9PEZI